MGFSGLFGQQLDRLIGVYALAEIEEVAVLGLKLQIVLYPDKEASLALNQGFEEFAAAFFVGIGQGVSRNAVAQSDVVELRFCEFRHPSLANLRPV